MASLKTLFDAQQAGFTVYSPDCTQSRLWGNLDHAIHNTTGFQPIYRRWINHDFNTINRFYLGKDEAEPPEQDPIEGAKKYDNVPLETLQYGHLVGKLFLSGPSLLTIWQGENVIPTLLALKGSTQPPQAGKATIRGSFWCDNGVANLTHASDDVDEALRELRAIRFSHLLDETFAPVPLIDPSPAPSDYAAHSGISVACDVVKRALIGTMETPKINLPPSGDAHETNTYLTAWLTDVRAQLPPTSSEIADFIDAYLAGNVIETSQRLAHLPVTRWEHFIIQCGAITRYTWNEQV